MDIIYECVVGSCLNSGTSKEGKPYCSRKLYLATKIEPSEYVSDCFGSQVREITIYQNKKDGTRNPLFDEAGSFKEKDFIMCFYNQKGYLSGFQKKEK